MSDEARSTRHMLLELLLSHKGGLTIDELSGMLTVSRNAVRQHLAALERDGLVAAGEMRRSVGRPSTMYTLSQRGEEQFPRQYSLLSNLVLAALRDLHGADATRTVLKQVATQLSGQLAPRVTGETLPARAEALAQVLSELGYVAEVEADGGAVAITAVNCVYHQLAAEFPEVCELDIDLIQRLSGARVEHSECMIRGGHCCRFRLSADAP